MRSLPFLTLLVACASDEALEAEVDTDLAITLRAMASPPVLDGCSDIFVYAASTDETRALEIQIEGDLAAEASERGEPMSITYALPDPAIRIVAKWGEALTSNHCDDVWFDDPVVEDEVAAHAGVLTLNLEPQDDGAAWFHPADATLMLRDIAFEDPHSGQERLLSVDLVDVLVGWYPG